MEITERAGSAREHPVLSVTKHLGIVPATEYFKRAVHGRDTAAYKVVRQGQFAYATIHLNEGSVGILREPKTGIVSPMYTVFEASSAVDPSYLLAVLKHGSSLRLFERLGQGSVNRRASIPFAALGKLFLCHPPLQEQRRIASILSAVDEALEKTEGVIERLEIFYRSLAEIMFKRALEFGSVSVSDIAEDVPYSCGGGPFGSDLTTKDYVSEGVPVIRGVNLSGRGRWVSEVGFVFVSQAKAADLAKNLAFPGDIVFTQRGTLGQVARIRVDSGYHRFVISQSQMKLSVDAKRMNPDFVLAFFRSPVGQASILDQAIATGVPHINLGILRSLLVPCPPMEEQEQISTVVAAIEDRIEGEQSVLSAFIALKAAVLDSLLSGRTRVQADEAAT